MFNNKRFVICRIHEFKIVVCYLNTTCDAASRSQPGYNKVFRIFFTKQNRRSQGFVSALNYLFFHLHSRVYNSHQYNVFNDFVFTMRICADMRSNIGAGSGPFVSIFQTGS
jgi:hypothetical protein